MKKLLIYISAFILIISSGGKLIAGDAKTQDWNASFETIPTDTDNISEGAQRIRNLKRDIRERFQQDHYMDLAGTQADHGEHKKVTFQSPLTSDPTNVANKGFLYTKDVSGKAELHWEDEDGNVKQLTDQGEFPYFPSGTSMPFYQDTCPAGWTIHISTNDGVAMITKGSAAGGETGGAGVVGGTWTQPNHTHTGPNHNHQWYNYIASSTSDDQSYNSSGSAVDFDQGTAKGGAYYSLPVRTLMNPPNQDLYTSNAGTGNTSGSATANTWRPYGFNFIICTKN